MFVAVPVVAFHEAHVSAAGGVTLFLAFLFEHYTLVQPTCPKDHGT